MSAACQRAWKKISATGVQENHNKREHVGLCCAGAADSHYYHELEVNCRQKKRKKRSATGFHNNHDKSRTGGKKRSATGFHKNQNKYQAREDGARVGASHYYHELEANRRQGANRGSSVRRIPIRRDRRGRESMTVATRLLSQIGYVLIPSVDIREAYMQLG